MIEILFTYTVDIKLICHKYELNMYTLYWSEKSLIILNNDIIIGAQSGAICAQRPFAIS